MLSPIFWDQGFVKYDLLETMGSNLLRLRAYTTLLNSLTKFREAIAQSQPGDKKSIIADWQNLYQFYQQEVLAKDYELPQTLSTELHRIIKLLAVEVPRWYAGRTTLAKRQEIVLKHLVTAIDYCQAVLSLD